LTTEFHRTKQRTGTDWWRNLESIRLESRAWLIYMV